MNERSSVFDGLQGQAGRLDADTYRSGLAGSLLKQAFDYLGAAALLLALSPVMLGIAIAIRLETRGPLFFRQPRYGLGGGVIMVTKFRTMRADMTDREGRVQTLPDDARVTRVGRFLRRTCLDELPQLWDVLAGRMSLVGPRPHPIGMEVAGVPITELIPGASRRLRARPGITGLAQVNGNRGPIHDPAMGRHRIRLDNFYIDRWSIWLDLMILLRTVTLPFKKGCY